MLWGDAGIDKALSRSRYTEEEQAEIRSILHEAAEVGIGTDLLLPRIQEARAKRVPADRLIVAIEAEIEKLELARRILLNTEIGGFEVLEDDAGWLRTANLLSWGATDNEIEELVGNSGDDIDAYLHASYLFSSLVEWGFTRELSLELANAVQKSSIEPGDYQGVFEILIESRRLHMQPGETAERLIEELGKASSLRKLRRKILR